MDSDTGELIEGVVVTASWILLQFWTTVPYQTLEVSETVTDKDGRYTLPAWGPRYRLYGRLRDDQPKVRFFRPGYIPLVVRNNSVYHPGLEGDLEHMIREDRGMMNGVPMYRYYEPEEHQVKLGHKSHRFLLEKFVGNDMQYLKIIKDNYNIKDVYIRTLEFLRGGRGCEWKQIPLTLVTLDRLSQEMETTVGAKWFSATNVGGQENCGNAEEYFKDYLK